MHTSACIGGRTARYVNPIAWDKGLVMGQCAKCEVRRDGLCWSCAVVVVVCVYGSVNPIVWGKGLVMGQCAKCEVRRGGLW